MAVKYTDREFGHWLAERRRHLRMSQPQVAAACGYSASQWARFEKGEARLTRELLDQIISVLSLDRMEAYRRAGLLAPEDVQPADERELLEYYKELPPICKYDMLTLARQLYENHVKFARRAARLSSQAANSLPKPPNEDWVMIATPAGALLAPPDWQDNPQVREVVERLRQASGEDTAKHKRSA